MNRGSCDIENHEENLDNVDPGLNDQSRENQNLGHVPTNQDALDDDVVIEKIDTSDNTVGESGNVNGASQATVIISTQDSRSKDEVSSPGKWKRKRKASASISSPQSSGSVASRTRNRLASKHVGKSPLCQTATASEAHLPIGHFK